MKANDIFTFNEYRSCGDLKRMFDKKQIDLSPDFNFQRKKNWNLVFKTLFLDSLLKNYPIPSVCFALDVGTQKRIVIDGLQRISTIIEFLDAVENDSDLILPSLLGVDDRLSGKTVKQIKNDNPDVINLIENYSIQATIIRCDLTKENDLSHLTILSRLSRLTDIFYRLNHHHLIHHL